MAEILKVILSKRNLSVSPWALFFLCNTCHLFFFFFFQKAGCSGEREVTLDGAKAEASLPGKCFVSTCCQWPTSNLGSPDPFEMLQLSLSSALSHGWGAPSLSPFPVLPGRSSSLYSLHPQISLLNSACFVFFV